MAGGGSSELKAVLEEIRRLDARLTECEKDLVRLTQQAEGLGASRVGQFASVLSQSDRTETGSSRRRSSKMPRPCGRHLTGDRAVDSGQSGVGAGAAASAGAPLAKVDAVRAAKKRQEEVGGHLGKHKPSQKKRGGG